MTTNEIHSYRAILRMSVAAHIVPPTEKRPATGAAERNSSAAIVAQEQTVESSVRAQLQLEELASRFDDINQENKEIVEDPEFAARLREMMAELPESTGSSNGLLDEMQELMERLQKEWLDRYSEILSKYVALFDKITTALNKLKDAITGTDDKGNFQVYFGAVINALQDVGSLSLGGKFSTEADAKAFLKELGVDWLKVSNRVGGKYQLELDKKFIDELTSLFQNNGGTMTPTEYNTLITAKDNIMERLMHINRVMPDKNQRKLQLWDTLVKTFSGTVESISEVNKSVVGNIGP